jgi:hypothetical protein
MINILEKSTELFNYTFSPAAIFLNKRSQHNSGLFLLEGVNSGAPEEIPVPVSLVASVVLLLTDMNNI